ncbi:hypothetical protein CBM2586_A50254 [Cupriavidus phytorum]|uniref:Uncharacterized protein n=1 Tax=Cupriavidus taiwanensis TaxID=164546 RepID=A0A375C367_9BURK|nr:hypothetical protein CBM2586_A50254 [Cupriavidus taiwanensis]
MPCQTPLLANGKAQDGAKLKMARGPRAG